MQTRLKTLDAANGRVGGYLVVWGSPAQRDLHGEYFTPQTELGLDWYPRRPVLYQHGLDGAVKAEMIGVLEVLKADDSGVWAEAQLDLRGRYARSILRLVEDGALGWSSGSLPHLVAVESDGHIRRWPIVEGSLTPTPAEPRHTDVHTLKSAYAALGLDDTRLGLTDFEGGHMTMDLTPDMIDAHQPPAEIPARKRLPLPESGGRKAQVVTVGSAYDPLNAADMLYGYMIMRSTKHFQGVSERYANALAHKVGKAGLSAMKSDELSYSAQAGYGDEWVPDLWSAQIWQRARQDNAILPLFKAIEMPKKLKWRDRSA